MKVVCQLKRTELGRHEKNKETVLCCHTDLFEAAHRIGYYSLRKTAPHHDVFFGVGKLRNTLDDVEQAPSDGRRLEIVSGEATRSRRDRQKCRV